MLTREQIQQIEALHENGHYMAKFCKDPEAWYAEACRIACGLGLRGGGVLKKRILDIGCGFGYFVKACEDLGHIATGIDRPEECIKRATWALRACFVPCIIEPRGKLPAELMHFDFVTMFGVNLKDGFPDPDYWGQELYSDLAKDIRSRLTPGGRWVLRPNQTQDSLSPIARLMDTEWWQVVAGPDATIRITEYEVHIQWPP